MARPLGPSPVIDRLILCLGLKVSVWSTVCVVCTLENGNTYFHNLCVRKGKGREEGVGEGRGGCNENRLRFAVFHL